MNLVNIYKQFPTQEVCIKFLEKIRWNEKPQCPYCLSKMSTLMKGESRYHCNICNTTFSVTVGTIFHKTKVDFQKWFLAITLLLNNEKNISARQLAKDIKINKNTSCYMLMRIKKSMTEQRELLQKIAEANGTYIYGKKKKVVKKKSQVIRTGI